MLLHSHKYTRVCNLQLESRDGTLFKYFKSTSSSPQTLTITEERETMSEFVKKAEEEVCRNHVTHWKYTPIVLKMVRSCQSLSLLFYSSKKYSRKHRKVCVMCQCVWACMAQAGISHGINLSILKHRLGVKPHNTIPANITRYSDTVIISGSVFSIIPSNFEYANNKRIPAGMHAYTEA